jgi:hypothetical protein
MHVYGRVTTEGVSSTVCVKVRCIRVCQVNVMSARAISCTIALLIAATSGAVTYITYSQMVEHDQTEGALIRGLALGENVFTIKPARSVEHKCYGRATISIREEDHSFTVVLAAWLKMKVGDTVVTPTLSGDIAVNPLGQVGGSIFKAQLGEKRVKLGSRNINPIIVTLFTNENDERPVLEQNVPGPFELIRDTSGKINLTGPALTNPLHLFDRQAAGASLTPLYEIVRGDTPHCTEESSVPLDMTFLSTLASKLDASILQKLPTL